MKALVLIVVLSISSSAYGQCRARVARVGCAGIARMGCVGRSVPVRMRIRPRRLVYMGVGTNCAGVAPACVREQYIAPAECVQAAIPAHVVEVTVPTIEVPACSVQANVVLAARPRLFGRLFGRLFNRRSARACSF